MLVTRLSLVAAVAFATCLFFALGASPMRAQTAFYDAAPSDLAGDPGTVIRALKISDMRGGASHHRVLYRSRGLKGEPIAVSGMIFVPAGEMPAGGWPIVAWAHPTSGLVSKCAPSMAAVGVDGVQGLQAMMEAGYVVTATDYPGLGTPGPHPYLVGLSEGRAVLDSVRAARDLVGGDAAAGTLLWGHSQGGQAVLYAADLAHQYAPELKLLGVAAAAPATDLKTLMDNDFATSGGKNLLAMTLWSWGQVFNAPVADVVETAAMKTVDALANVCLESIADMLPRMIDGAELDRDFLSVSNITSLEPWKGLMEENTIGALPPHIPVLLVQGSADTTVEPAVTSAYLETLCKGGSRAALLSLPNVDHLTVAQKGAPSAIAWMADRLAGKQPATNCPGG